MQNRFKHLAQQNNDPVQKPIFDKSRWREHETKTKKAVDILKITLRNSYNELVATSSWNLPDDYTIRLAETIRGVVNDAIKYNRQYAEAIKEEDKPNLPSMQDKQMQISDKLIYDLMNDINKTYREK
jgi:hypothetical protein